MAKATVGARLTTEVTRDTLARVVGLECVSEGTEEHVRVDTAVGRFESRWA
ncbi:MAG: hypothetical protein M0Z51_09780 [Propionibacterium sp.]|nr:hypothetical protein [Propionibacterium sp.]